MIDQPRYYCARHLADLRRPTYEDRRFVVEVVFVVFEQWRSPAVPANCPFVVLIDVHADLRPDNGPADAVECYVCPYTDRAAYFDPRRGEETFLK